MEDKQRVKEKGDDLQKEEQYQGGTGKGKMCLFTRGRRKGRGGRGGGLLRGKEN